MNAIANPQPLQFFIEQGWKDDPTPDHIFKRTSFHGLIRGDHIPDATDLRLLLTSPLVFNLLAGAADTIILSDSYEEPEKRHIFWQESNIDLDADGKKFVSDDGLWTVEVHADGSAKLGLVTSHPLFFNAVSMLCSKMRTMGLDYDGEIEGVETDEGGRTTVSAGLLLQDFTMPISQEEWAFVGKAAGGTFRIYRI